MIESTSLNIHDKDKWSAAYKKYSLIQPFFEDEVQLTVLAKKHGIPLRTAKRWVKNYRESGIAGLLAKGRNPYGVRVSEKLQKIIEGMALRTPRLSIAAIQRAIKPAAEKIMNCFQVIQLYTGLFVRLIRLCLS